MQSVNQLLVVGDLNMLEERATFPEAEVMLQCLLSLHGHGISLLHG